MCLLLLLMCSLFTVALFLISPSAESVFLLMLIAEFAFTLYLPNLFTAQYMSSIERDDC